MRLRTGIIALALIGALGAGGITGFEKARTRYLAPGPLPEQRTLIIPHGSPSEIGPKLREAGLIANPTDFRAAAFLTAYAGPLRAGEFVFPAAASLKDVMAILRNARPVQHRLTIPEGLTAAQIAILLDRAEALSGDPMVPAEGAMMPQSYAYEHGMSRAAIVERASLAMQRTIARLWSERADNLPLDTPNDLVTLASIVERETARPEERGRVAGVLLNRLKRGMKLQSDPTVIYAASGGLATGGRTITRAELDRDNPYNTYRTTGLPPTPIGSPGLASLQAVARPQNTEDLYFVADGTGGHAFAKTLEDHNRNVARYLATR